MSTFDYNRIGELRVRADRAEARADRYDALANQLEPLIRSLGTPTAKRFADELLKALAWDGSPKAAAAVPTFRQTHRWGDA